MQTENALVLRQNTLPEGYFRVVAALHPFKLDLKIVASFPQGMTLQDLAKALNGGTYAAHLNFTVDDWEAPDWLWPSIKPKAGTNVYVRAMPSGGKRSIFTLVIAIAAAVIAPYIAGPAVLNLATISTTAYNIGVGVIGAVITLGGSALVGAIFPPSNPRSGFGDRTPFSRSPSESPTFSITQARNQARPYQPVPCVLGTHKHVPPYGATPYTEIEGNNQFLRFVVIWSYGPVNVTDIKIGNTPISSFEEVEQEDDFDGTLDSLTLYPVDVDQEDLSISLDTDFQIRNTATDIDEFGITISWPRGLFRQSGASRANTSVTVTAEYREVGDSAWTPWFETEYTDNTAEVKRVSVRETNITRGTYEIRVKRDALTDDVQVIEQTVWASLRSFKNEDPINLAGVAKSAFRIKATDQLNGVVDELNGIVSLKIPTWGGDSAGWAGENVTSNPAAIFRYVLKGAPNKNPLGDDLVDDTKLGEWYEFCETEGFAYDSVIDYRTSIRDLLIDVAAAGRASPHLSDGKWSVIIEQPLDTVVQHFTPRNSNGFQANLVLPKIPEALRIRFLNEDVGYQEDERTVYDDGFDENNATLFEVLELPGITDPDNIYRLGRYYLAGVRLRPEMFTFSTDLEHLVATRGDLIRFSHDVPLIGQAQGRIVSIDGNNLTLDEPVNMTEGLSYKIRVRQSNGNTNLQTVTTVAGSRQFEITVASASGMAAGDLFMFGLSGEESIELVITQVENQEELAATITAVPYQAGVYTAADVIPEYTSVISTPVSRSFEGPPPPVITNVVTDESALFRNAEGAIQPSIILYIRPGTVANAGNSTVTQTIEFRIRFRRSGTNDPYTYLPRVDADTQSVQITQVVTGQGYTIQVQAVSVAGGVSDYSTVSNVIVIGASEAPPQVDTFSLNTIGDHTYVEWTYPSIPIDVTKYELRYHPDQDVTDWSSMLVLADEIPRASRSFTVPSRKGSYAIKAIDVLDLYSTQAKFVNATLEDPEAFNVEETITEDPGFTGTKTNVVKIGSTLQLDSASTMSDWTTLADVTTLSYGGGQGFEEEGFYEFGETDLSEIYTSRITVSADIGSLSFLSFMNQWATLAEVDTLSGNDSGDLYMVEIQIAYDATNDSAPTYSDWQRLAIGDYTARRVKFRARLTTQSNEISPVINSLSVSIDMPDRIEDDDDVASGAGTKSITFSPAFRELRTVTINGQDLNTGDYWRTTNKTRTGFDITFYDSGDNPVDRTFDWQAIGYGRERGT